MNEPDKGRRNVAASVRARLLNKARAEKLDFNLLLTRYALERMLYRLSVSEQRGQFLLKGALLFDLWFDVPHRPTHDADLLGFGRSAQAQRRRRGPTIPARPCHRRIRRFAP